jgi:phospholipase/carboxylesterase
LAPETFRGIEWLPDTRPVRQLFILLHGVGANAAELVPLANRLRAAFPEAAILIPDGPEPFDGQGDGRPDRRQWFSVRDLTDENRAARVAAAMPALLALVRDAQDRLCVLRPDTALVGFSQGATMALEFSSAHDGAVGRVLAFSGRYATLPDKAPELTTLHLFHGESDQIVPVAHAHAAYDRLAALHGDATLDVASSVAHELHPALAARGIQRLQTCIPLRSWKRALDGAQSTQSKSNQ